MYSDICYEFTIKKITYQTTTVLVIMVDSTSVSCENWTQCITTVTTSKTVTTSRTMDNDMICPQFFSDKTYANLKGHNTLYGTKHRNS